MDAHDCFWDYLIVTASGESQAQAYSSQLDLRREFGLLQGVGEAFVVADPGGKRIGSGGSTIRCLEVVLQKERDKKGTQLAERHILEDLRILIIHAGGDSKRLPAYAACGKLFMPVPGESDTAFPTTIFDRQVPTYLALPSGRKKGGQIVITSGDVLLTFDPQQVDFSGDGVTGLGALSSPEIASGHGVYCVGKAGLVKRFLQKPLPSEQRYYGATDRYGQTVLDIGVVSFDSKVALRLLRIGEKLREAIFRWGLDFYREICCALGKETSFDEYQFWTRRSGSELDPEILRFIYEALREIPFRAQIVRRCRFLHFGTSLELISSGLTLLAQDFGLREVDQPVNVNNEIMEGASVTGRRSWVEGSRIDSLLRLEGDNLVVGAVIREPVNLVEGACLDVVPGRSRKGEKVWFVRCYGIRDSFKGGENDTFCGRPVMDWLRAVGGRPEDLWKEDLPEGERSSWNARFFPAIREPSEASEWLWLYEPEKAGVEEKTKWREADRYSLAEISARTDHQKFFAFRRELRSSWIRKRLKRMFRTESEFSASELALILAESPDREELLADLFTEAHLHASGNGAGSLFVCSRILHTIATALQRTFRNGTLIEKIAPRLDEKISPPCKGWLAAQRLLPTKETRIENWTGQLKSAAFRNFRVIIIRSAKNSRRQPRNVLRQDEIVWGRCPARLDLGGGWTDTPPYSLEWGGCVINAAVDLNGLPPIQCFARVTKEPVVRIRSIDLGSELVVRSLQELMDYRQPGSEFALAKAAIALSGLGPDYGGWPEGRDLEEVLESFGGGIELTTLAAIPKGSGLGTSSIMGAVVLAVLARLMGLRMTPRELFHAVLRLEQELTTGGGWQDQVGGALAGVKLIRTNPGLIPDPSVRYVPADVLDPQVNGGTTLLYYTGITRLARNILEKVVGRYLDRDRSAMATLRRLYRLPPLVADAMARKDIGEFGRLINVAWRLNKELDPESSNAQIEEILARVGPHIHGAKLLGAGGGGFLLLICHSPRAAAEVRGLLEEEPPNERARFFDFSINNEGLVVTLC